MQLPTVLQKLSMIWKIKGFKNLKVTNKYALKTIIEMKYLDHT